MNDSAKQVLVCSRICGRLPVAISIENKEDHIELVPAWRLLNN